MNRIRYLCVSIALLCCSWAIAGPVNVNTADAETISAELTGVGLARARAIVAYRAEHGPFASIEELLKVKGIGERTLEMNADNIRLSTERVASE